MKSYGDLRKIEEYEKPYHLSQLNRLRDRVGPERLEDIMNSLREDLSERGIIRSGPRLLMPPSSRPRTYVIPGIA